MKQAVLFAMAGLLILGWSVTGKELMEKPVRYQQLLEEGEQYESDEIYVRAIESYKEALNYYPGSREVKIRIAKDYLALGDESSFINQCNGMNQEYGYPEEVVILLADYYIENRRNESAVHLLQDALKNHKGGEEVMKRYEKVRYTYKDFYLGYDDIFPFRNDSTVIVEEGRYGLMNTGGKTIVRCVNEWIGVLSGDRSVIPVLKDGKFYYANSSGYRIEVPRKEQFVEELGVLCNGMAPAKINGNYGYINERFEELSPFVWEKATVIQNGFGAVCQNGKWALIGEAFELITDYVYEDVITDSYGYCSISGRAFVKTKEGYRMVNEKGEFVGEELYQKAVAFVTDEPTAVKKGEKWGFIDVDGNLVIEPQYEEAGAFSNGLAPVKTLNGWGFINQEGRLVIEDTFTEARSFYHGLAPVKKGNTWTVIELNVKS
ncbi:hypothetical protein D3Z58_06155 [Clostridiaceae bacterium]|nr:hypothetical protein [Clostridiaceae bacterium]